MEEKKGTEIQWLIFSVIIVIIPVVIAIVISAIINSEMPEIAEVLNSIIMIVFSIACNLFSVCLNSYHQKKDKKVLYCLLSTGIFIFVSWTLYVFSLTITNIAYMEILCFIFSIIAIFCSVMGWKLGKRSDEYNNELIQKMHRNCNKIRKKFIESKENGYLNALIAHENELLCSPEKMKGVDLTIQNIMKERETHKCVE